MRLIKRRTKRSQAPTKADMEFLNAIRKAYDEADVVVTREAYESWYWDPKVGTRGGWHSNSPAVFHVDFGRLPNRRPPPVAEIKIWCRKRGIPEREAFLIARSIGEKGTPPREITRKVIRKFKFGKMTARVGQHKVL